MANLLEAVLSVVPGHRLVLWTEVVVVVPVLVPVSAAPVVPVVPVVVVVVVAAAAAAGEVHSAANRN